MLKQFHPCDWAYVVKDFTDLVYDKVFEKMPYKLWREFDAILTDYNIENVRVYWKQTGIQTISIYFDTADGKTLPPYAFDSNDNSFGSFLYENYLYGDELQMKVKDHYSEWQTYSSDTNYDKSAIEEYLKNTTITYSDPADVEFCTGYTPDTKINTTINEKENVSMKFNFDFGPVNSQVARLSIYGMAIKNKVGTYVSYDPKTKDLVDVDVLNFDGAKFLYKMPVAIKDIAIGDVIVHQNVPMFVVAIAINDGYVTAVDPVAGERKDIMLTKSPFGFNFATKVVNLLGNLNAGATAENPFGNLGLMLMLSDNKDMGDLLPLMMMTGNGGALDMSNPMMMWALMGNRTNDPMMLAMAMGAFNKPAHTCNCGGHCGENHTQA